MTVEKYIADREQERFIIITYENRNVVILYDSDETIYEPSKLIMNSLVDDVMKTSKGDIVTIAC